MLEREETPGEKIGYGLATFLVMLIHVPVWCWAALTLWCWFIAPLFPGLPVLTWQTIWGLSLAIAMFKGSKLPRRKSDEVTGKQWLVWAIARMLFPPLAVGIGWLLKP